MARYVLYPFAIILACLLLYFYPMQAAYQQQDQIAYNLAYQATSNFVDSVRNKGYITPAMYNDFTRELGTSNLYDIQMEHRAKQYNPVYLDPLDATTFTGKTDVYYDARYTKSILASLFPGGSSSDLAESRRYYMREGDFFSVTVRNTNTTKASLLHNFLTNDQTGDSTRVYIPYGGMILNEDY
ncbi:hypothetical protein OIN60_00565 [Paenibacillus sp. P96]|uniref:Uncharacterized protein n=1 Tax=Paenibacillus zeirhizosphaerae TaxID=2987519 RepID=A0ABT9FKN3_9BACL|nr:hypothetical protein [Paenibacillus sp. P96]MDP4095284.1 hypothetical protein [Paenibacillus sp. P96]